MKHRAYGTIGQRQREVGAYLGEWWAFALHHKARAAWSR